MCHGNDASRIVELRISAGQAAVESRGAYKIEQKRVATTAHGIVHATMRHSGSSVWRRDHYIHFGLLRPPVEESGLVCFTFARKLPVFVGALRVPIADETSPDAVAFDVIHVQVMHVLDEAGKTHVSDHLRGAQVVPLASSEVRHESLTSIAEE